MYFPHRSLYYRFKHVSHKFQPFVSSAINRKEINSSFKYDIVLPQKVSEKKTIGNDIIKPAYFFSGIPDKPPRGIEIKSKSQIKALRNSCSLASSILKSLQDFIKVGITTDEIDEFVHNACIGNGAYPSPLNYYNFPKSVCTSVNNVACHGIPDSRSLKNGDILNVDITVFRENMHGDCSAMFVVGHTDERGQELCSLTKEALLAGISVCKPGRLFSEIGKIIQEVVQSRNFSVVPAFVGHGIGSYFHGLPDIYHFDTTATDLDSGEKMEEGMTFTIEPVLTEGGSDIIILEDGWTAVTTDNSRTAQWEHTVLITKNGVEILTL